MSNEMVGYKRPPKKNRFRPGQSGNLKGRPRKETVPQNIESVFVAMMKEKIEITENGVRRKVDKFELFLRGMLARAYKGHAVSEKNMIVMLERYFNRRSVEAREVKKVNLNRKPLTIEEARRAYQEILDEALREGQDSD